ncbi:AI-2E family transporter [Paraclostridium bifermentans]|jgi:predicted PurR-regulated permease PerM|uniref:AI-2E family transporter n=1 Tax=Paraclostridium bifermentans TaxID=1490 RepID=UPI0018985012|nr:AI-2E family transporter [Paraclostridium bifermentans]MBS5952332.1 AI-2E family transporter [Paraclostridium bifermentans]MBU5287726.1 AI-2E family transporter [Paraclostridium bifermentans]MDU3335205.1 AI-2E family transporter [Paraclostridium bifermentans]
MKKLLDEISNSVRYIIPIIIFFIGVILYKNFDHIITFTKTNITIISGVLTPFIIGFLIAYILNKPMTFLQNKFKLNRGISVSIIYGILLACLVFIWLYVVPIIQKNITDLYSFMPHNINEIEDLINSILSTFKISTKNPESTLQIKEFITNSIIPTMTSIAGVLSQTLLELIGLVVTYTVNIFLGIVISIYFLISKEKTIQIVNDLCECLFGKFYLKAKEFGKILDKNIGSYIIAKFIDSLIYGTFCTIILVLLKSHYPVFVGIIIGVTNMIPFFGPIIGTVVAVFINLFFSFDKALWVLVVMIVVQQLESAILEPHFVGKQVGVPPVLTILAVTLAGKYTGFIGMMLSVPIMGVIIIYVNRYMANKKQPQKLSKTD